MRNRSDVPSADTSGITPSLRVPDLVPHLSAGAHRSPKRGACFMEFASFLAGERWSDHPPCTDAVLATLARAVNDTIADDRRDELVPHIPRVIGLRDDSGDLAYVVALRAAATALPVASMDRQRTLAVGILTVEQVLAARGVRADAVLAAAEAAIADVPDAAAWAERFLDVLPARGDLRRGLDLIVRTAAIGVAEACIDDRDTLLATMLADAIADAEGVLAGAGADTAAPVAAERMPVAV